MSTTNPEVAPATTAQALSQTFGRLGAHYLKWLGRVMGHSGLSPARLKLMGALHCDGPKIMSDLADGLGVTNRNVTALVDGLEEEGVVARSPHPKDRRATVVALTPEGDVRAAELWTEYQAKAAEVFEVLSKEEQATLLRLTTRVLEELDRRGVD